MPNLNKIDAIEQELRIKRQEAYRKVEKIRKNESSEQKWRREIAGLEWVTDFLLESSALIRNCLYDGKKLKHLQNSGDVTKGDGGYDFGFAVPDVLPIHFSLYVTELYEKRKQLVQCPKCSLVYCLPSEIDILDLRKQKMPFFYQILNKK